MPFKQITEGRPSPSSEEKALEQKDFFTWLQEQTTEPRTPTDAVTVVEPDTPPPTLVLPPTIEFRALPPIPRRKVPLSQVPAVTKKTLPVLPDAASIAIERTANHRIQKRRPSSRPRMNKKPRSSPYHCRHCGVTCTGRVQYFEHLRSRKHQVWINKDRFECEICNVKATSKKDLERHTLGRTHRETVRKN